MTSYLIKYDDDEEDDDDDGCGSSGWIKCDLS